MDSIAVEPAQTAKINLIGLDLAELEEVLAPLNLRSFRLGQLWQQMYRLGARLLI